MSDFSHLHFQPEDFTQYREYRRLLEENTRILGKNSSWLRHELERETTIYQLRFLTGLCLLSRYPRLYGDFNAFQSIAGATEDRRNRGLEIWFKNWREGCPEIVDVIPSRKIERVPRALCNASTITPIAWRKAAAGIIIPISEGGSQIVLEEDSRHLHQSKNLYRFRTAHELGLQNTFDLMELNGDMASFTEQVYKVLGKDILIKMMDEVLFPSMHQLIYIMARSNLASEALAKKTCAAIDSLRSEIVSAIENVDATGWTVPTEEIFRKITQRKTVKLEYLSDGKYFFTCKRCGTDTATPLHEKVICRNCGAQYHLEWGLKCVCCGIENDVSAPWPEEIVCRKCSASYKKSKSA
ncbi:MAG: hypothetical protein V1850_01955 [Candidatus Bathyarchaeota archaeon]